MNTEEKARRYDEALNWMREIYPGLHGATKEDAEHFFPELAESEDERIRKAIIELLKEVGRDDTGISENAKCMIAYLEKQKEQKPSAELGEEDDNALALFHELISFGYTERFCDAQTADDMRRWLNERLKSLLLQGGKDSLQTHWKPSVKQLAALDGVIADTDCSRAYVLRELWNQLKKLQNNNL